MRTIVGVQSMLRWAAIPTVALLGFGLGCGDDSVATKDTADTQTAETASDVVATETVTDATTAETRDTTVTTETSVPPDITVDNTPPKITSTTPADGDENVALPLTVTIVFSEKVNAAQIATQTIKLRDAFNAEVPGKPVLSADGTTVTWTPTTQNLQAASPYTIEVVGNIIVDMNGNRLAQAYHATFTTKGFVNQDDYRTLAAKYAPTIYSAVLDNVLPQAQIPTKLDPDGDLNLANNKAWLISATKVVPAVYYTVTETYTHFYIHYMYFFPYVNSPASDALRAHSNGASGVMVTIEKAHDLEAERPIGAVVYWRSGGGNFTNEEEFGFVTNESGIVAAGSDASVFRVEVAEPQAELFPSDRFQSFIGAQTHMHCNRNAKLPGTFSFCKTKGSDYTGDQLVFAYAGGAPTEVQAKDGKFPSKMADVEGAPASFGYALIPLFTSLWPHRFEDAGDQIFQEQTFDFQADEGRPGGGTRLTVKFIDSIQASDTSWGKPLWSWGWNPTVGPSGGTYNRTGMIALDPAWYFWTRFHSSSKPNSLVEYNADTGAGFATTYCFNGFLSTDVRTSDPKCGQSL